jgi:hypothetical protein
VAKYRLAYPQELLSDELAPVVVTIRSDVVTQMSLARNFIYGKRFCSQGIV